MPQAAGTWFATYIAGIGGGALAYNVAYAAAYVATLATISIGLSKVSASLAGRPKDGAAMRSRTAVVRASTEYRTIIYGEARVGGVLVYANTSGNKNQYMDFVVVIAGHQVDAITDVWFDDERIVNADINSGNAAGGEVGGTGKFKPQGGDAVAAIYKYLGTDTQAASSILTTDYSDEWTSNHRLRGCAYVHIRLRRAGSTWEQGAPGNFTFLVKGAKVYDPRLDTTAGGSGSHRVADPSTWAYSNNAALCVADYLIGGSITNSATRVNWRGFGADPAEVNWTSVISAANICDDAVVVPGPVYQARYTADGALSTGELPSDNLEQLLTSMMGQLTYASDGYRLYAGAYQTPTLTLTEADLAGELSCTSDTPRADRYNAVKGTRWDLETGQEVEFLPRTSSTYETEDGAQLFREIELPFTLDEYRAQRIAQIILRRSREQETVVMHCSPGALRVAVWETVSLTLAELGISSKVYRCLAREEHADDSVTLTLREETSATYTDPAVGDYGALSPADPVAVPSDALGAPTALAATSTTDSVWLDITPDPANGPGVEFEIYEYTASTPFASSNLVWTGTATSVLLPRRTYTAAYFWVRARRGAAVSDVFPSGAGVLGYQMRPYKSALVVDPEFEDSSLATWPHRNRATWVTGGMYAGMVRLAANGSNQCYVGTDQSYTPVGGSAIWAGVLFGDWTIKVNLRWRVNSALSGSLQRLEVWVGMRFKSDTTYYGLDVEYVDLSTAVTGTWYTSSVTLDYSGTVSSGKGPRPWVMLQLDYLDVTGGEVDIDYCNAEIIG